MIFAFAQHGTAFYTALICPQGYGSIPVSAEGRGSDGGRIVILTPPGSCGRIHINECGVCSILFVDEWRLGFSVGDEQARFGGERLYPCCWIQPRKQLAPIGVQHGGGRIVLRVIRVIVSVVFVQREETGIGLCRGFYQAHSRAPAQSDTRRVLQRQAVVIAEVLPVPDDRHAMVYAVISQIVKLGSNCREGSTDYVVHHFSSEPRHIWRRRVLRKRQHVHDILRNRHPPGICKSIGGTVLVGCVERFHIGH